MAEPKAVTPSLYNAIFAGADASGPTDPLQAFNEAKAFANLEEQFASESTFLVESGGSEDRGSATAIDICLVMDTTGSMETWIRQAKNYIKAVLEQVKKKFEGKKDIKFRAAFVSYKDFVDTHLTRDPNQIDSINFTEEIPNVVMKVEQQQPTGGDGPEDVAGGFTRALSLNWQSNLKFSILIADAPCHGRRFTVSSGDHYPDNDFEIVRLVEQFADKDINLMITKVNSYTDRMVREFKVKAPRRCTG
jgi:hypothetical protein